MIKTIDIYKLNIPLENPYFLSYGKVENFETIVAVINSQYAGSFTDLKGYFNISFNDIWNELNKTAPLLIKKENINSNSKLLGPLKIALERMNISIGPLKVPLIRIINKGITAISSEEILDYKIKVGNNLKEDIEFAKSVLSNINPKSRLRIDANQGYDLNSALSFISAVGTSFEYIEQPFPIDKWEWNKNLINRTGVKIMIDEAIDNIKSIKKAKDSGALFVKLKIAKFGSIAKAIEAMKFAEGLGLKVIIGNGVDIDTSNYLEAFIWQNGKTKMAGEMNGFLKPIIKSDKLCVKDNLFFDNPNGKELIFNNLSDKIILEKKHYE